MIRPMLRTFARRRLAALAVAAVACLVLAGCMLSPGRFVSSLDVRKDGRFSFSYNGEINVLALSKLAEMGRGNPATEPFAAHCHKSEARPGGASDRPCSAGEVADQRKAWEEARSASAAKRDRDAQSMKAMFGGIDPSDPGAAAEFAARLRRQAGWRKVEIRGDGLFVVDFAVTGQLDHDFAFPTIERFPAANPFVQVVLRADGTVRIDAPAFAPAAAGEPYRGWMQAAMLSEGKKDMPQLPQLDGRFTITTDAQVLANNTDDAPQSSAAGQTLEWSVNARSTAAPMALLRPGR